MTMRIFQSFPVRRSRVESYLLLTLIALAMSVIVTRVFLEATCVICVRRTAQLIRTRAGTRRNWAIK
jgi:hypothetical protein